MITCGEGRRSICLFSHSHIHCRNVANHIIKCKIVGFYRVGRQPHISAVKEGVIARISED